MSERHLLVGVFSGIEAVLEAGRLVKGKGFQVIEIFSPFPSDEIEKAIGEENSPIRYFTLLGGLLGFTGGFALTVGVALRHGIVTGGKPVIAIPPFVIIAFELTILLGALFTMLGFLWKARSRRRIPAGSYCKGYTEDQFGLVLACGEGEAEEAMELLSGAGALEVRNVLG
jgi:molybdopterin-containing oxidoreductase family membrane subunit